MRRTISVLAFTAVLASAAASFTVLPDAARMTTVQREATFLVPANDGYGVADCLTSGSECGGVVADAWCEAQGFKRSISFGPAAADDVTGWAESVAPNRAAERPIAITCGT